MREDAFGLFRREVVLTIHLRGGQHSQLHVQKPKTGEHGCQTPDAALAVMARMATRFSDPAIAATLNRMGVRTGQGKTWTAHRVGSIRKVHGMHAFRSAEKDGVWFTMREAAAKLGVTSYVIRRLIQDRVLPAEQVVQGAPWQIQAKDLDSEPVIKALARKGRPRHTPAQGASRYLKKRDTMNQRGDRADLVLYRIGVELEETVLEEARQAGPETESIADVGGELGSFGRRDSCASSQGFRAATTGADAARRAARRPPAPCIAPAPRRRRAARCGAAPPRRRASPRSAPV